MQGRTHEIGSVAAALAIAPLTHIQNNNTLVYAGFLICAGIGGLLPDADLPNSTIGKKIFPLAWPMYLIRRILNLLKRFIPSLEKITRLMAHRGIRHTPIMWLVILLPSFIFLRPVWRIYLIVVVLFLYCMTELTAYIKGVIQ